MWPFDRRRFRDVVQRQLALFADEHAELAAQAREALRQYSAARDEVDGQLAYARYDDLAEDVEELLYDMCERFGATLDDRLTAAYVREFDRQARRAYGDLLPRLSFRTPDD